MTGNTIPKSTGRTAGLLMAVAAVSVFLASCATPATVGRIDASPQTLIENNQAIVLFHGSLAALDGVAVKVGGAPVNFDSRKSFAVDVSETRHEVMFVANANFRGVFNFIRSYLRGAVTYEFTPGKMYILVVREKTGTQTAAFFFGALVPRSYEMALYEYNGSLKNGYDKKQVLFKTDLQKEKKADFIAFKPAAAQAAPAQAAQSASPDYFISTNNQPAGPYSFEELKKMAQAGQLRKDSLVWREGMQQWVVAGSMIELDSLFAAPPPLPPR
ncbi:MAG: DUF4339 domain-containing protein [Treponema sp.]|jgi:hypothetical protein|nr:DUF4339 domain-containing protein [Treponema sp.]